MKNCPNLDGVVNLIVVPSNSRKQMVGLQESDIYLPRETKLEPLSPNEKLALDQKASIARLKAQDAPEFAIDLAKSRIEKLNLSPAFLELIEKMRFNLIFILNVRAGDMSDLKSYIDLNLYVNKGGGKTSVIAGENIKEAAAKLFMEVDPENRYLPPEAVLEFGLSSNVSDPGFFYDDDDLDHELKERAHSDVQERREEEIAWLRRKLLNTTGLADDPLRQMIDKIPMELPKPGERANKYPIVLYGQEVIERGWAKGTIDPASVLSRITGIKREDLPLDILQTLRIKSASSSGTL